MERWLPVVGYEGCYEVSDLGRVRSVERLARSVRSASGFRRVPPRMRAQTLQNKYPAVNLSKQGLAQMRSVHVLMLEAFVGPRPSPMHEGCHGDGDPLNSRLDNLRWGTKAENKADSFEHGTAVHGVRVHGAKLDPVAVRAIQGDPRGATTIAREKGVSKSTIQRARNGKTWSRSMSEVGVRG